VLLSPNLRWTEKADFSAILSSVFGSVPILYCQEIRALALGHLALNADAGDFLLVDSGSGVGAAAIAAGRLYSGPLPLSGELGHTPVLGNKRKCGCGSVGCLETLVSRTGLVASAAENGHAVGWRELLELLADDPTPAWLKKTLDSTAVTIASALNILGLRQVVLTGGFTELPTDSIEYLRQAILADAMWARFGSVTCVTAPRHRQAGLVSLSIDRTLFGARAAR
jgi:predicted NBD/HSP70 family sugar kinase